MISRIKTFVTFCLLVSLVVPPVYAQLNSSDDASTGDMISGQSDYTAGLQAYINNDYFLAQQSWLKAAKKSHAKAMFNLGLLHQEQQIAAATEQKAANWFLLAGKYGYPASYYHYAGILRDRGETTDAQALIRKAADQGYQPAKQLTQPSAQQSTQDQQGQTIVRDERAESIQIAPIKVTPTQARIDQKPTIANAVVNNVKNNAKNNVQWIGSQAASNWTIQLVAYPELDKINAFIKKYDLNDAVYYHDTSNNKQGLYKLIYGSYLSKEQADKARQSLSQELLAQGPWLRTLQSVQSSIK